MTNISSKKIILSSVLIFLVLIYVLSFISVEHNKNKNVFQSALLNSKYEIGSIVISDMKGSIELKNYVDFWGGKFTDYPDEYFYFPCETKIVDDFIRESKKIIPLEKISSIDDKNEKQKNVLFKTFGFDKENIIDLSFYDMENNCVSRIYFGFINQSKDQIFIKTLKGNFVYSIPVKILDYLNVSIDFWNESEILPKSVFPLDYKNQIQNIKYCIEKNSFKNASEEFIDKFPSYRHSVSLTDFQNPDTENSADLLLEVFDGTGNECTISFTKTIYDGEECFCTCRKIIPGDLWNPEQKNFIQKINVLTTISNWTFNSILELLEKK